MATSLPEFPAFDIDNNQTSLGISWDKWLTRLKNLLVALDITDAERKKAILLHYAGPKVSEIFSTLTVSDGDDDVFKKAVVVLTEEFDLRNILL